METGRGKKFLKCMTLFMAVLMMTGCGELKTDAEAVKWADKQYGIQSKVLDRIQLEESWQYIMESDDGVVFELNTEMKPWGVDGTIFGETEVTSSNYYAKLIEFYTEDINDIEKKYQVRFMAGNKGIISSIYKENPNLPNPEKDVSDMSKAVKALADLLHPKKSYDLNHGNRIFMTEDLNTKEHGEYCFEFNEKDAGEVVDQRNSYYRQTNQTYPQIKKDAIKWGKYKFPDYYGVAFRFYLPKEIALIEAYPEKDVVNEQFYVDIKKYNKLYEEKKGSITEEDFEDCIMMQ